MSTKMTDTVTRPQRRSEQKTQGPPPYDVVLLDDHEHSFDYVIGMLEELFGHTLKPTHKMRNS